jgi:hypothetical protein
MRWDASMNEFAKKRFWLNLISGVLLVVFLIFVAGTVWAIAKDVRVGQRRLAAVESLTESERAALFQACLGLATRKMGPVEFESWPEAVVALKPDRLQVRENGVLVELNTKRFAYAAVMLSRESKANPWRLDLVNFDGAQEFWPPQTVE